jgi:hypothetical protein
MPRGRAKSRSKIRLLQMTLGATTFTAVAALFVTATSPFSEHRATVASPAHHSRSNPRTEASKPLVSPTQVRGPSTASATHRGDLPHDRTITEEPRAEDPVIDSNAATLAVGPAATPVFEPEAHWPARALVWEFDSFGYARDLKNHVDSRHDIELVVVVGRVSGSRWGVWVEADSQEDAVSHSIELRKRLGFPAFEAWSEPLPEGPS